MVQHTWSWSSRAVGLAATVLVAGLSIPASVAHAQEDIQRRAERAIRGSELPEDFRNRPDSSLQLLERTQLDFGGYASFTALWLDDAGNNNRRLFSPEIGIYARASIDGGHTIFGRAKFTYRTFSSGDSFDNRGDRWTEPFLDRYWYEFDLRRAVIASEGQDPGFNVNLRAGRQFVEWGAGLVLSETLYAVRPTIEFSPQLSFMGIFGITPDHTVDFDGSRAGFDEKTRRAFFGGMLAYRFETGQEIYGYYMRMEDYNNDSVSRFPVLTGVEFDYDANFFGVGTQGSVGSNWEYLGEFVLELGRSTSDPLRGAQQSERILAFAGRGQASYLFRDENASRLQVEALFASGDGDRLVSTDTVGGNLAGSTDRAFNSLGFANTGLAFSASFSNLWSIRAGASTFPLASISGLENLQVGIDGFVFNKMTPSGGFDESTTNNMYLGSEVDAYINYRITSDVAVNLRYGAFFPGEAIAGSKDTRHFVLLGVTFSF